MEGLFAFLKLIFNCNLSNSCVPDFLLDSANISFAPSCLSTISYVKIRSPGLVGIQHISN